MRSSFTDDRPGTVEVSVRGTDNQIAITVSDNGAGCPAEVKEGLGTRLIQLLTALDERDDDAYGPAGGLQRAGYCRAR
jgi:two-component sensor histidine kinase